MYLEQKQALGHAVQVLTAVTVGIICLTGTASYCLRVVGCLLEKN